MRDWIDKNYPGLGIMIGEWSFGGEGHMSGALATAEALGRFAQHEVKAAFYWTAPPDSSPSFWAFRAYRDFDGKGGRFQDYFVPSKAPASTSMFLSRDAAGKRLVAVVLNLSNEQAWSASFDASTCGAIAERRVFTYAGSPSGFSRGEVARGESGSFRQTLAPYTVTVIDMDLASPLPPVP